MPLVASTSRIVLSGESGSSLLQAMTALNGARKMAVNRIQRGLAGEGSAVIDTTFKRRWRGLSECIKRPSTSGTDISSSSTTTSITLHLTPDECVVNLAIMSVLAEAALEVLEALLKSLTNDNACFEWLYYSRNTAIGILSMYAHFQKLNAPWFPCQGCGLPLPGTVCAAGARVDLVPAEAPSSADAPIPHHVTLLSPLQILDTCLSSFERLLNVERCKGLADCSSLCSSEAREAVDGCKAYINGFCEVIEGVAVGPVVKAVIETDTSKDDRQMAHTIIGKIIRYAQQASLLYARALVTHAHAILASTSTPSSEGGAAAASTGGGGAAGSSTVASATDDSWSSSSSITEVHSRAMAKLQHAFDAIARSGCRTAAFMDIHAAVSLTDKYTSTLASLRELMAQTVVMEAIDKQLATMHAAEAATTTTSGASASASASGEQAIALPTVDQMKAILAVDSPIALLSRITLFNTLATISPALAKMVALAPASCVLNSENDAEAADKRLKDDDAVRVFMCEGESGMGAIIRERALSKMKSIGTIDGAIIEIEGQYEAFLSSGKGAGKDQERTLDSVLRVVNVARQLPSILPALDWAKEAARMLEDKDKPADCTTMKIHAGRIDITRTQLRDQVALYRKRAETTQSPAVRSMAVVMELALQSVVDEVGALAAKLKKQITAAEKEAAKAGASAAAKASTS